MNKELTLLIVEDDPIIAADIARQVRKFGYAVSAKLRSGELAIAFVRDNPPDLILMDIQLEGQLSGIETAARILAQHPLPIIYLTANTDDVTRRAARQTAPAAFLSKPFRNTDLQSAIEIALDNFQQGRGAKTAPTPAPVPAAKDSAFLLRDRLFVKDKRRFVRLMVDQITHASAEDYYCRLYTNGREYHLSLTLKKLEAALTDRPEFMRVHRSHLINVLHVTEVGELRVYLNQFELPINRTAREELLNRLQKV